MVSKHSGPTRGRGYRSSESELFLGNMPNSQWILMRHGQAWRPPTDVYETEDSVVVKVEVAGMAEEDFSIVFSEQTLVITGTRRDYATKRGYHQMEIPYGEFRTEVYLSEPVDTDNVEALYKDGFLTVNLPVRKARRVTIHPNTES
jgi:HSP20 family protein